MEKKALHPTIAHLSAAEIADLIDGYIAGESAADLLARFKVTCSANQLRNVLPPKQLNQQCSVCSQPMVQELPRRGSSKRYSCKVRCSVCDHEEVERCNCQHCAEQRSADAIKKLESYRNSIKAAVQGERNAPEFCNTGLNIDSLSLSQAVAFLAFSRCSLLEEHDVYSPLRSSAIPFSPTASWGEELLLSLRQAGLIDVSEYSAVGTITIEDGAINFDAMNVHWTVTTAAPQELIKQIEHAGLSGKWPAHWQDETALIWQKLAMSECRQIYEYTAAERGLQAGGDVAVNTMLSNILRDFSVAQCYRIILNGAMKTADFMARENPNRRHAANYMVGACQRRADQARTAEWEVYPSHRNSKLPRSMLSYVLFDVIFKIGECGFNEIVVHPDNYEQYIP